LTLKNTIRLSFKVERQDNSIIFSALFNFHYRNSIYRPLYSCLDEKSLFWSTLWWKSLGQWIELTER